MSNVMLYLRISRCEKTEIITPINVDDIWKTFQPLWENDIFSDRTLEQDHY